jgi:hypothetical protein
MPMVRKILMALFFTGLGWIVSVFEYIAGFSLKSTSPKL